jgi:hypothetical protein
MGVLLRLLPVAAIEPDIRGATTIRQQLAKHRSHESCNRCHRQIDPPGFALESFDVIGGQREWYRIAQGGQFVSTPLHPQAPQAAVRYQRGSAVDASGTLPATRALTITHLIGSIIGVLVHYLLAFGRFFDRPVPN